MMASNERILCGRCKYPLKEHRDNGDYICPLCGARYVKVMKGAFFQGLVLNGGRSGYPVSSR